MAECTRFGEDVVGLLEGTASDDLFAHVSECDACRDQRHDVEVGIDAAKQAGDDYVLSSEAATRLLELAAQRASETRVRTQAPVSDAAKAAPAGKAPPRSRTKYAVLAAALAVGVLGSAAVGFKLADRSRSPQTLASRAFEGKIAKVVRSGADKQGGLTVAWKAGGEKKPIDAGARVQEGMRLETDPRTRARLELDDGTILVLDRATEIVIGKDPRSLELTGGAAVLEVAHVAGAPPARVSTKSGDVKILGTKLQITATEDRTNVEVLRGEVEVSSRGKTALVRAGQEGLLGAGEVEVVPANDLATRLAFGEAAERHNEDTDAPVSGLGELRAKKPGSATEKDRAVRLAKHDVKIRVVGGVARTEIEEVFQNDTDDELEGIFRFPLPPGAQIERLGLDVDGKMVDGEFVDKVKAAAIWRGAIQNATPKQPKPREEIIWVPGPWHDPALLEWQRGGRSELRIFPIPKRGSRRVSIAYTETLPLQGKTRRYTYPLPQGASSAIAIDTFSVDLQVLGAASDKSVRVRGYELERVAAEGEAQKLTQTIRSFTPSGDLVVELEPKDAAADAVAWAYTDTRAEAPSAKPAPAPAAQPQPTSESFVAVALRPRLPKWADVKPHDQVIVVDTGRAMFGERLSRARRLAVQMIQEMDRRDRVTVVACDVGCKAMPQGFVGPGSGGAHDADAFLSGVTADGASDLVGAVQFAGRLPGRDKARELRVVVLSDGVASAGYRTPERVGAEVKAALEDPTATVTAVPIGADADAPWLTELAKGGGGVTVAYEPGQPLEAAALDVLNATYGTTLRDVEIVLPEGLSDVAPRSMAPIRAGSEAIVTARMKSDHVQGDVIVRGKVGGEAFEAKYPIDVRATSDTKNAFVPRLFAQRRIADMERDGGEATRPELVSLSRRYSTPSKFTSLLVLESEAMFTAFGIQRASRAATWTGESLADAQTVALGHAGGGKGAGGADDEAQQSLLGGALAANPFTGDSPMDKAEAKKDSAGFAGGGRLSGPAPVSPSPAATTAPPPASKAAPRGWEEIDAPRRRRGGQFMKRIFVRRATVVNDAGAVVAEDKVSQARAAVAASPDERGKHKDLAKLLAQAGRLDELDESLKKWGERDPLDADLLVMRADVMARRGDRDGALRVLSGALSAHGLGAKDSFEWAGQVASAFERAGRAEACNFRVAAAEARREDVDAIARAVACERSRGRTRAADAWLAGAKNAKAVEAAVAKVSSSEAAPFGDIVVRAAWDGGSDLDVGVIAPSGERMSWASRGRGVRVSDTLSNDRETVAVPAPSAGSYVIEITRAKKGQTPVSGKLFVQAFGQQSTIPFTISGDRAQVGRVDVRFEAELVPASPDEVEQTFAPPPSVAPFDRAAAANALAAVSVSHCVTSRDREGGPGAAMVVFGTSGTVQSVSVTSNVGLSPIETACISAAFRRATIPAFSGSPVTVRKGFFIPGSQL